jgi:hypothetical protein
LGVGTSPYADTNPYSCSERKDADLKERLINTTCRESRRDQKIIKLARKETKRKEKEEEIGNGRRHGGFS